MYNCVFCNFSSKLRSDWNRHLNTMKHIKNQESLATIDQNNISMSQNEPVMSQNEPSMSQNEPVMSQNNSIIIQNDSLDLDILESIENDLNCQYCNKLFNTIPNRNISLHSNPNVPEAYIPPKAKIVINPSL